ncbi:helix-hairpin-helix domain-containing protein [Pseudalkalibacillus caeni]|uniref:Helix-hairpin-helix DNA-binding motif class 1 domain-containing protein n=1 Tax=Exobacillus caeni TaxID=2574798 RepID=A0A5R9FCE8_9BACL|nr:helix-hairpin-helix domain-containing protein [Pseudalkalibacillus caeni]TLS39338.1 hypothetical protein FCL54_03270 [Pseudalkalibacillus caeni]
MKWTMREKVLAGAVACFSFFLMGDKFLMDGTGADNSIVENYTDANIDQTNEVTQQEDIKKQASGMIKIDIKGAVKKPGVYEISSEKRVIDAIETAGGYGDGADISNLNLAGKLSDEMVVYVPAEGEEITGFEGLAGNQSESEGDKVSLNHGTSEQLQTLPGIGPSKAEAIVTYREEHGGFQTIEELKQVGGIGDKTFEKLEKQLKLN